MKKRKIRITQLLRPHWAALALAFLAILGETITDLLDPWPLTVVLDNVIGNKKLPHCMEGFVVSWLGEDKTAMLHFAIAAVIVIAVVGAISSYAEKYLTTSVGQWVMHDLRTTLYHHIHRRAA